MAYNAATYQAILNDLNRDVARQQPADVWQFCANWFNSKLEEQRSTHQQRPLQPAALNQKDTRSMSLPASNVHHVQPLKKKPSIPSLMGQGYSFGGASTLSSLQSNIENVLSPYSEVGPTPTNVEAPSYAFGASSTPSQLAPIRGIRQPASPQRSNNTTPTASSPSTWSKSYKSTPTPVDIASKDVSMGSDDEDEYPRRDSSDAMLTPAAAPQATSPLGIPLSYNLGRRTSVSAESLDPAALGNGAPMPKTVIPKTASQRARIESSIKGNLLFRNLDEDQHNDVLNAMKEVTVPQGTEVIVQGAVGDFFYVVEQGQFEVWVTPPSQHSYDPVTKTTSTSSHPAKKVATIEAGGSFGELALMYNAPRSATVVAVSPSSTLWALDRVTFRSILMEHTSRKRKMYEVFLAEVNLLASLEPHERAKIADALEEKVYEEGEAVVIEGEVGKNFYIIESGTAEVSKRRPGNAEEERVSVLGKGDYFGELALLNSAPRAATVRAMPGCGRLRVATLGEKAFTRLLGPVSDMLQRRAASAYGTNTPNASHSHNHGLPAHMASGGSLRSHRGNTPTTAMIMS